ncbi:hypothetical protein RhiirA4_422629 [Rhizophagus irregularis]|uniref:Uncharacterized protein n=1 Tax=Rhizophagus irregularis TaxID=588596 RepID=A0A2I1GQU2_9GLOM|nr:hypothetical protein RhiirA4_422629 [Rhizophagus irregularis]
MNLTKKKEEEIIIKNLWNFIYEELKTRIWIPRCEEIKRLEEKEGIQKIDLRKKRIREEGFQEGIAEEDEETEKLRKIGKTTEKLEKKKFNKNINLVTLDRLKGLITDGINISNTWDLTTKIL